MAGQNQLLSKFITLAYHSPVDKTSDPKIKLLDKFHQHRRDKKWPDSRVSQTLQASLLDYNFLTNAFILDNLVATSAAKKMGSLFKLPK